MCRAPEELRQRYLSRIPRLFYFAGYTCLGMATSEEKMGSLKDMEFGPNDVVIASYPKSGTTWASEILSAIAHEGDIQLLRSTKISDRVPWMESDDRNLATMFPQLSSGRKRVVTPAKMRVYFTHLPLELLPQSILQGKCKLLYVARNPKDQAVSFYYFHRMAKFLGVQTDLPWGEYLSLFCSGDLWCRSWFDHVQSYWKFARNNPKAKFVTYEDLKRDLMGQMEHLEQFVGVSLSMDQRIDVVEHCSFDCMKENRMINRDGNLLLDQKETKFMRKGVVGDWKNYFTVAQSDAFDELYKKKMEGSGLQFEMFLLILLLTTAASAIVSPPTPPPIGRFEYVDHDVTADNSSTVSILPNPDLTKFASPTGMCNVTVFVGLEVKMLIVSKEFLAMQSPVIAATLQEEFVEENLLVIEDAAYEDFVALLEVIFPGRGMITDDTVNAILKLGHRYRIERALALAESHLKTSQRFATAEKLQLADQFGLSGLVTHCLQGYDSIYRLRDLKYTSVYATFSDSLKAAISDRFMELM